MKKKNYLNRITAFVMAVIMIISLAVFDNRFGTKASAGNGKQINLEDYFGSAIENPEVDEAGKIDLTKIDGKEIYIPLGTEVTFSGNYLLQKLPADTAAAEPAFDVAGTEAADPKEAATIPAVNISGDADACDYGVYIFDSENNNYVFAGIIGLHADDGATPEVTVTRETASNVVEKADDDGTYDYAIHDTTVTYEIEAADGRGADADETEGSVIDKVVYTKDGGAEIPISADPDGKYQLEVTEAGNYVIKAYNKAGRTSNAVTKKVIFANPLEILEVRVNNPADILGSADKITHILSQSDSATVDVQVSGDPYAAPVLYYTLSIAGEDPEVKQVDMTKAGEKDGKTIYQASFTIPQNSLANSRLYKLSAEVENSTFPDDVRTEVDILEDGGAIVFLDDTAPVVDFSNIEVTYIDTDGSQNTVTFESIDEYNASSVKGTWIKDISYTLNVDEEYSYVKKVTEKADSTESMLVDDAGGFSYTKDISLPADVTDGEHSYTYSATNYVGKASDEETLAVKIDRNAPVVTVKSGSTEYVSGGDYLIQNPGGQGIQVDISDSASHIAQASVVCYKYVNSVWEPAESISQDDGDENHVGGTITLQDVGEYKIDVYAVDKAGNSITESYLFVVDNSEPKGKIQAIVTKDGETTTINPEISYVYTNGDFIDVIYTVTGYDLNEDDVKAVATYTEPGSATKQEIACEIKKQNNGTVTAAYQITKEGYYDFSFAAKRHSAKDFGTDYQQIHIAYDKTAPDITMAGFKDYVFVRDGVYFYKTNPVVVVEASDAFGILKYSVRDSSGDVIMTKTIEGTATTVSEELSLSNLEANKVYTIDFYAEDLAGNNFAKVFSGKFVIDKKAPTVSISGVSESGRLGKYWYNGDVEINLAASDNFYVTKFEAEATRNGQQINSNKEREIDPTASGSTHFTYTKSGLYEVKVYAYDEVGNKSAVKTCTFVIDDEKPTVEISGIPEDGIYAGDSIEISVKDDRGIVPENVKVTEYYETYDYDGKNGTKGTKTHKVVKDSSKKVSSTIKECQNIDDKVCKYYIIVEGTDRAGNPFKEKSTVFYYDSTAPTVTVTPDISNDGTVYYRKKVKFNVNVEEQFPLATDVYVFDYDTYNGITDINSYKKKALYSFKMTGKTSDSFEVNVSAQGRYHWIAVAVDKAGNEGSSADFKFVIDKKGPVIEVTGIPEDKKYYQTEIGINITDEYAVASRDVSIIEHIETYDGEVSERAIDAKQKGTTSVQALISKCDVIDGKACAYYFTIEVTDKAGNVTNYKTTKFYYDNTKPKVVVVPVPSKVNDGYYKKAVSYTVKVSEQFAMQHSVLITDKNKEINGDEDRQYTLKGVKGSYDITEDKEGRYDMDIIVTDAFGNKVTKNIGYVIDYTKPVVTLSSVPKINNSDVAVGINITDNFMGARYVVHVVRKDAGGNVVYDSDLRDETWSGTEVNPQLSFSDEGDYTVTVTAYDKAGNVSDEKLTGFRIDKTAPVLSITGVEDMQKTDCTAVMSINEAFGYAYEDAGFNTDDVSVKITKKTDGKPETTIATMNYSNFSSGNPHTANYLFEEDGEYTISFNAKDMSGNAATPVTRTFKVDKTAPILAVSAFDKDNLAVKEYATISGASETDANYVDITLSVTETFFLTDKIDIKVTKDNQDVTKDFFKEFTGNSEVSTTTQRFSEDGVYTIDIIAEDALGNQSEPYNLVFTVDNKAPVISETDTYKAFQSKADENGDILLNEQDIAAVGEKGYEAFWNVEDATVFTADVKLDGVNFVDFSNLADGFHTLSITAVDEAGHVAEKKFEFTYDGTAPRIIITGVENGEHVKEPFTMNISLEDADDIITEISINGNKVDPSLYQDTNSYSYAVEEFGAYKVVVTAKDAAGNIASTYDSTTGEVFSFHLGETVSMLLIFIIILIVVILLALLIFIILKKRKNDNKRKTA